MLARLGASIDPALAAGAGREAAAARAAIDRTLRRDGVMVDYLRSDGWAEPHLALDAMTLLRFDAVAEERAQVMLEQAREHLESRRNADQPYGDFGMLGVWPPFADRAALRAKSAFPYRYHNGGDWPWLDGLYAAERLRRGLGGWRYPLTRWWAACLEHGWAGPVEHFSAPFGRGSLLQAWSSLPACRGAGLGRPGAGRGPWRSLSGVPPQAALDAAATSWSGARPDACSFRTC